MSGTALNRRLLVSNRLPGKHAVVIIQFNHLNRLVAGNVAKDLRCAACGPVDLEEGDPLRLRQADVLLKRVASPATTRADVPVDGERTISRRDDLEPRPDCRPICFCSGQFHAQPVIPLSWVLEEDIVVAVAGGCAAHLDEQIDVAVAIPIGAGDAMSFLEVTSTRGNRDVGEPPAVNVFEHAIGNQDIESGAPVPR